MLFCSLRQYNVKRSRMYPITPTVHCVIDTSAFLLSFFFFLKHLCQLPPSGSAIIKRNKHTTHLICLYKLRSWSDDRLLTLAFSCTYTLLLKADQPWFRVLLGFNTVGSFSQWSGFCFFFFIQKCESCCTGALMCRWGKRRHSVGLRVEAMKLCLYRFLILSLCIYELCFGLWCDTEVAFIIASHFDTGWGKVQNARQGNLKLFFYFIFLNFVIFIFRSSWVIFQPTLHIHLF